MKRQMIRVLTATAAMTLVAAQPAMAGTLSGSNKSCKVVVGVMQGGSSCNLGQLGSLGQSCKPSQSCNSKFIIR